MTTGITQAAQDALPPAHAATVTAAFTFMTWCAASAGIPHAEHWQLDYFAGGICPWRVIDSAASRGGGGNDHVAITFTCGRAELVAVEMHCYAIAWRGLTELRHIGTSGDLIATSRRWPPASASPAADSQ